VPINGTSFAAPFVTGVVALVRARFPTLTAGQVMELIKRTAHTGGTGPNAATGYGVIDPVAALTYQLPSLTSMPNPDVGRPIPSPPRRERDNRVRNIVLSVTGVCVALSLIALAVLMPGQMRRTRTESADRNASEPLAHADADNADAER